MQLRLKSGLWVRATLRRASATGGSAMVLRKGDEDAGSIFIVLTDPAGNVALLREEGTNWRRLAFDDEKALDDYLSRQQGYDPDLWIIELGLDNVARPVEKELGSRLCGSEGES